MFYVNSISALGNVLCKNIVYQIIYRNVFWIILDFYIYKKIYILYFFWGGGVV